MATGVAEQKQTVLNARGSATFQRKALESALNVVAPLAKCMTKPVIECVRVIVGESAATVDATNLETWAQVEITQVEVFHQFSCAVDAKRLHAIIRTMPGETVNLEMDKDRLRVSGDSSSFVLPTQKVEDMPPAPDQAENKELVAIPAKEFLRLGKQTVFATGDDSRFPGIRGVLIEASGNKLRFVATDCKLLAVASLALAEEADGSVLVPPDALRLILAAMGDGEEEVKIASAENRAIFCCDGITIATLLIEGNFPAYQTELSAERTGRFCLVREALLDATKQASLVMSNEPGGHCIRFDISKKGIGMMAGGFLGDFKTGIPCKVDGQATIGLDARFLLSALGAADPKGEVTGQFSEPHKSVLFSLGNYQWAIFPMTLNHLR